MLHALRKRISEKKGFTLIELIVVIAVIAILAVILIPRFARFTNEARKKSAMSDARYILMAIEAMDAAGDIKFTGPEGSTELDLDALYEEVNKYLGNDVISGTSTPAADSDDGTSALTAAKKTVEDGKVTITFTYIKKLGGTNYTVTYDGTAFKVT